MSQQPRARFFVEVAGLPSDDDDSEVPGIYEVALPTDYPAKSAVAAVLDAFHSKIGIAMLDDFDIAVKDAVGNILAEDEGNDPYAHIGEAEFIGRAFERPLSP